MLLKLLRYLRHGPFKSADTFWRFLGGVYRKTAAKKDRHVNQYIGDYGPFKFDPHFAFSNFSNWGNLHNDGFERCVEACSGKKVAFDIGAHIGLVTMPMASVIAAGGRVVSFEPADVNGEFLKKHVKINGLEDIVTIEHLMLGDTNLEDQIFYESSSDSGMNSVASGANISGCRKSHKRQVTLDTYCYENKVFPEVIKIDVEGAEISVLEGASKVIEAYQPLIYLSVHPRHIELLGKTIEDLIVLIEHLGYSCRQADGLAVTEFALKEYILIPQGPKNATID